MLVPSPQEPIKEKEKKESTKSKIGLVCWQELTGGWEQESARKFARNVSWGQSLRWELVVHQAEHWANGGASRSSLVEEGTRLVQGWGSWENGIICWEAQQSRGNERSCSTKCLKSHFPCFSLTRIQYGQREFGKRNTGQNPQHYYFYYFKQCITTSKYHFPVFWGGISRPRGSLGVAINATFCFWEKYKDSLFFHIYVSVYLYFCTFIIFHVKIVLTQKWGRLSH